jgi:hypothetical protein
MQLIHSLKSAQFQPSNHEVKNPVSKFAFSTCSTCTAYILVIPVELRTLRSSGVAKCMQTRFATHPKPVGLPPFHVTLFCSHKTRFN